MSPTDLAGMALAALRGHRLRTRMTYTAIAIGIGSVLLLTALGEGAREWVAGQFATIGANVLAVLPGRTETRGGPPMVPTTTHDLTLADMEAIRRRVPGVLRVVPITVGETTATFEGRGRTVAVIGSSPEFLTLRRLRVDVGENLPDVEAERGAATCVIGRNVRRALFGERNAIGARIRLGDYRFRVSGVIGEAGRSMAVDLDDLVLVPVANALRMFNRKGLFRIVVEVSSAEGLAQAQRRVREVLVERHDHEEDFTILTPGAVAASLSDVIAILTAALAAIAAVSLLVAGIGVMNVMVVSVTERRAEIGLMKAVGAANRQVLALFLTEALALALIGGLGGIAGGIGLTALARAHFSDIPFRVPTWALLAATGLACGVGVVFGILPAMRAARLDPLESLRRKV